MITRVHINFLLTFGIGMICGQLLYFQLISLNDILLPFKYRNNEFAISHDDIKDASGPNLPLSIHSKSEIFHQAVEADRLAKEVRVLCWIMTSPDNHKKKAVHVKATWAKRCNKVLFMSTKEDEVLGSIALNVTEGRIYLWSKTKAAFTYIMENHINDADWFLKADDDTYVVVENLRYMLSSYNSSDPLYFGLRFKTAIKQEYMSGGAGYVLSKKAVQKLVEEGIPNRKKCKVSPYGAEDLQLGLCLQRIGVFSVDTRDNLGRGRFFPFVPQHHLVPGIVTESHWYWKYIYYPAKTGLECCSDTAITFHYVKPDHMYEMEYLIYHLRPYGINFKTPFPAPLPPDQSRSIKMDESLEYEIDELPGIRSTTNQQQVFTYEELQEIVNALGIF